MFWSMLLLGPIQNWSQWVLRKDSSEGDWEEVGRRSSELGIDFKGTQESINLLACPQRRRVKESWEHRMPESASAELWATG